MKCVKVLYNTIPTFGSRHKTIYGRMLAEHEGVQKVVHYGKVDANGDTYITFNRKRYYYVNSGSQYNPVFEFKGETKKYSVTFHVEATHTIEVETDNLSNAMEFAKRVFANKDFKEISNTRGWVYEVKDENGKKLW